MIYACRHGNLEFVKVLVEKGADVNVTDKNNKLPLNYVEAKIKQNPERDEYKKIRELLIKNGAQDKWNKY